MASGQGNVASDHGLNAPHHRPPPARIATYTIYWAQESLLGIPMNFSNNASNMLLASTAAKSEWFLKNMTLLQWWKCGYDLWYHIRHKKRHSYRLAHTWITRMGLLTFGSNCAFGYTSNQDGHHFQLGFSTLMPADKCLALYFPDNCLWNTPVRCENGAAAQAKFSVNWVIGLSIYSSSWKLFTYWHGRNVWENNWKPGHEIQWLHMRTHYDTKHPGSGRLVAR